MKFDLIRRYRRFVLVLSLLLLCSVLPSVPLSASAAGGYHQVHLPVLMYHYVDVVPAGADYTLHDLTVAPDRFQQQMQWLKDNGYHTLTPDVLADALLNGAVVPDKSVLLTFDDGYADAYYNVFPVLKQMGFTGVFFVVTGFIDKGSGPYLNWDQVKQMAAAGMSIQDHSATHQTMRGRTHEWLVTEVDSTLDEIQAHTGSRPRFFAYPYGSYDQNTVKAVRATGYIAAFTTRGSSYLDNYHMLTLPRVRVKGNTTLVDFAGFMRWDH